MTTTTGRTTKFDVEQAARRLGVELFASKTTVQHGNWNYRVATMVTFEWPDGDRQSMELRGTTGVQRDRLFSAIKAVSIRNSRILKAPRVNDSPRNPDGSKR